jgi:hypothetical protein
MCGVGQEVKGIDSGCGVFFPKLFENVSGSRENKLLANSDEREEMSYDCIQNGKPRRGLEILALSEMG